MGLKGLLEQNKIQVPGDFDERLNLVVLGLKKDPSFESELAKFKSKTTGGADVSTSLPQMPKLDTEDWMGPNIIGFLNVVTSPEARGLLKTLFMVIFFISYLESIPVFGSILSVTLDIMVAANKAIIKAVQTSLPPALGLLPIPYASMVGMIMAAMFGAFVWPMVAMVAFSRQDFSSAIESFLRVIPSPFGSIIADSFLEANKMLARIESKRQKLVHDIASALVLIQDTVKDVSSKLNANIDKVNSDVGNIDENMQSFSDRLKDSATLGELPEIPSLTPYKSLVSQSSPKPSPVPVSEPVSQPPVPVSQEPKTSFPPMPTTRKSFDPTPVGARRRKRLSTIRRRKANKWTRTLRTKSGRR